MKFMILALVVGFVGVAQSEAAPCKKTGTIAVAAESVFTKKEEPAAGDVHFAGSKNGKDKWIVDMSVDEECMTSAVVYTVKDTCRVTGAAEIGQRDCG